MKRLKGLLFIGIAFFFLFPFFVNAKDANVIVDSVTHVSDQEVLDGVNIVTEPIIDGLNISFGLEFTKVGGKVVYKVLIKNQDSEDYQLKLPESVDGYVSYQYQFDDNSDVLKKNTSKTLFITINYKEEVPDASLVNGKYLENKNFSLTLLDNSGNVVNLKNGNPKTGQSLLLLIIITFFIIISAYCVFRYQRNVKSFIFLLTVGLMILPISILAMKSVNISINSDVEVAKIKNFCYLDYVSGVANNKNTSLEMKTGSTMKELFKSHSESTIATVENELLDGAEFVTSETDDNCGKNVIIFYTNSQLETMFGGSSDEVFGEFANWDSIVKDSDQGCYFISRHICSEDSEG